MSMNDDPLAPPKRYRGTLGPGNGKRQWRGVIWIDARPYWVSVFTDPGSKEAALVLEEKKELPARVV